MIKGVPEELQVAYNQNPQQYDLLGVMADAADENNEPEVAECLRWLWRWKRVPVVTPVGACWYWPIRMSFKVPKELPDSLRAFCADWYEQDTPMRCVERVTKGFPKWKQLYSEEYQRLSVPPSTLIQPTTPS